MSTLIVPGGERYYEIVDLTPAWASAAQTIIFHHGLGATSGIWSQWFPILADRFRLVRFDLSGHGKSAVWTSDCLISLDILADEIFAIADAANAPTFHLVGESIGGTIALNAAIRRSERILSLTVSNGAHLGSSIEAVNDWRTIIERRGMAAWSKGMMQSRFFEGAISAEMWQWFEREQALVSSDFLLDALAILIETDLSAQLKFINLPVLLLHGDSSPFIPVAVMADLKSKLPDCGLQVFAHARHGLPFSHAKTCAKMLRSFLEKKGF
jgi:pimeloyl-ACP methyl ester carboxylesterase